ncbi:MAG: ester cyclase [Bacteroidota bacterium]
MSREANETIRIFIEEVFNKGNFSILEEIIHPEYRYSSPEGQLEGIDQLKDLIQGLRKGFPDLNLSIDDLFVADNRTCTRITLTGTHQGKYMGISATEKTIKVTGVVVSRLADGKIIEEWEILDMLSFFQQLGLVSELS